MKKYLTQKISIAPLAVFRALFGFIMFVSTVRFAAMGWIHELYIQPDFFFTFYGFDWVQPFGVFGMYAVFVAMGLAALCIMLGYYYRIAIVLFFLTFSYVELLDKTNYLNHYYFVSIISLLLMFVPAHRSFSLDILRKPDLKVDKVPAWMINIFKLQLGIVYFFAGAAKLNPDWLFGAMPMKIWLPAKSHLPLIGWLFEYKVTAFVFSWAGALYDLTVAFFLLYKPTRVFAYISVIIFHMMTYFLFQIGMFPFIMILSTLIFFSAKFHEMLIAKFQSFGKQVLQKLSIGIPKSSTSQSNRPKELRLSKNTSTVLTVILGMHFLLQLALPLRFALYPGNIFWTEQGYRFSWRVMLMEKTGHTVFHVYNPETDRSWEVSNYDFLTQNQEKMMSTQPDMILQFAHYLEEQYQMEGKQDVEITVEARVTLNGRKSQLMIDPKVDLTKVERGFHHKDWVLRMQNDKENWFTDN